MSPHDQPIPSPSPLHRSLILSRLLTIIFFLSFHSSLPSEFLLSFSSSSSSVLANESVLNFNSSAPSLSIASIHRCRVGIGGRGKERGSDSKQVHTNKNEEDQGKLREEEVGIGGEPPLELFSPYPRLDYSVIVFQFNFTSSYFLRPRSTPPASSSTPNLHSFSSSSSSSASTSSSASLANDDEWPDEVEAKHPTQHRIKNGAVIGNEAAVEEMEQEEVRVGTTELQCNGERFPEFNFNQHHSPLPSPHLHHQQQLSNFQSSLFFPLDVRPPNHEQEKPSSSNRLYSFFASLLALNSSSSVPLTSISTSSSSSSFRYAFVMNYSFALTSQQLRQCQLHFLETATLQYVNENDGNVLSGAVNFTSAKVVRAAIPSSTLIASYKAAKQLIYPSSSSASSSSASSRSSPSSPSSSPSSSSSFDPLSSLGGTSFLSTSSLLHGIDSAVQPVVSGITAPLGDTVVPLMGSVFSDLIGNPLGGALEGNVAGKAAKDINAHVDEPVGKIFAGSIVHTMKAALPTKLAERLTQFITTEATRQLTTYITQRVANLVVKSIASDVGKPLASELVIESLPSLSHTLTHLLSATIVPALLHSMGSIHGAGPSRDVGIGGFYCYYCHAEGLYCDYCRPLLSEVYYAEYYAAYYSQYYGEYWSEWEMQKVLKDEERKEWMEVQVMGDENYDELVLPGPKPEEIPDPGPTVVTSN